MSEKPLERLNYFNGQRLQAGDFKLEQDYHMRVRRWLNRSLYTAGIAMGLEIYPVAGAPRVRINPGLAIDPLGREIILLEAREIPVMHDIGQGAQLAGSYIVIRYNEELIAQQDATCSPASNCGDKAATGGPSRVLADPVIECVPDLPQEASGKVLLGRVRMTEGCGSVASIDSSVRSYIGNAMAATVKQYALEGVRDVDEDNSSTIVFHIRGQQPTSVTLYMRSEKFPTYFYTELGKHTHALVLGQSSETEDAVPNTIPHSHPVSLQAASVGSSHPHGFEAYRFRLTGDFNSTGDPDKGDLAFLMFDKDAKAVVLQQFIPPMIPSPWAFPDGASHDDITMQVKGVFTNGEHSHGVMGRTDSEPVSYPHRHKFTPTGSISPFGASIAADTSGLSLTFVDNLQLSIDGEPVTSRVLAQVRNNGEQGGDWSKLGQGTGATSDLLATFGTGPIKLDYIVSLAEGEHVIELSSPAIASKRNGGRIHFNLYVE